MKLKQNNREFNSDKRSKTGNKTIWKEPSLQQQGFISAEDKVLRISALFREIMIILGLDVEKDGLADTPKRVAKMYVEELFKGLDANNKPVLTFFENSSMYNQMVLVKNVSFVSVCEHHFMPIIGEVHVGYIVSDSLIGLSKINRIIDYCARKPQVQERFTVELANELMESLGTGDVAVWVEAKHLCVSARGIEDKESVTTTSWFEGKFENPALKSEFIAGIKR